MSAPGVLLGILLVAAAGYVLMHVNVLAQRLQDFYVRRAMRVQAKKNWNSYLFIYNPDTWKTPFARFLFKSGVIFFGIWLLLVAYATAFGPVII
jgi:hypothetical protein